MDREILAFGSSKEFETWLKAHHEQTVGVWLRIAKKDSGERSITYAEALDVALCYGWIDGQKDKHDEAAWLQSFSKRKQGSIWSQVNKGHVERLIASRRMRKPGLAAIEMAKQSGQWDAAYQPTSSRAIPEDFGAALNASPKARQFFDSLSSQNRFAFVFRVSTAKKPETRQKRITEFVRMLENGEVFHPKKA